MGKTRVTSVSRSITPELAARWLGENRNNRAVSDKTVERYAQAMRDHQWRLTGEAIKFCSDGRLLDGQHRLEACVRAGVPFVSVVLFEIADSAVEAMDIGKKRLASDYLTYEGYHSTSVLAPAASYLRQIVTGTVGNQTRGLPYSEISQAVKDHPQLESSVALSGQWSRTVLMPRSQVAALHCLFAEAIGDAEIATLFWAAVASGANLDADDPIFQLRERLQQNRLRKRAGWMSPHETIALSIKAWNACRNNERMTVLIYRTTELYPQIGMEKARTPRLRKGEAAIRKARETKKRNATEAERKVA